MQLLDHDNNIQCLLLETENTVRVLENECELHFVYKYLKFAHI